MSFNDSVGTQHPNDIAVNGRFVGEGAPIDDNYGGKCLAGGVYSVSSSGDSLEACEASWGRRYIFVGIEYEATQKKCLYASLIGGTGTWNADYFAVVFPYWLGEKEWFWKVM